LPQTENATVPVHCPLGARKRQPRRRRIISHASPDDELAEGPPSFSARAAVISTIKGSDVSVADPVLDKIKTAALEDKQMIELRVAIINCFPNDKCNISLSIRPFWTYGLSLQLASQMG
jgi:hypothetical protein